MKSKTDALIFALVLVIANYKPINGIALDCLYEVRSFPYIDANVYTCVGKVLFDATVNENVTWVYGVHETGKGNGDVHGIVLREQNLEFIPTNIEQFFQNIIVIDLTDNIITSVSNRHLTPFPNLQYLSFIRNEITSLDGDLFAGINSMNMKLISFTANDVRHVGHDLNLPLNGAISFTDNPCISQTAFTPDEVASLKLNLLRSCPPTISQIEQSLESRQNLLTSIEWQVQGLIKTMDETRNDITSLRQDNTYLWGVVQELYNRVAELEAIIGGQGDHKSVVQFLNDSSGNNELTNRP